MIYAEDWIWLCIKGRYLLTNMWWHLPIGLSNLEVYDFKGISRHQLQIRGLLVLKRILALSQGEKVRLGDLGRILMRFGE